MSFFFFPIDVFIQNPRTKSPKLCLFSGYIYVRHHSLKVRKSVFPSASKTHILCSVKKRLVFLCIGNQPSLLGTSIGNKSSFLLSIVALLTAVESRVKEEGFILAYSLMGKHIVLKKAQGQKQKDVRSCPGSPDFLL